MDREGIPIAFGITPGNESEQTSMIPLEKKLIEKFDMSKFVVCTDAGLSSATNRWFNDYDKEDGFRFHHYTVDQKAEASERLRLSIQPGGVWLADPGTRLMISVPLMKKPTGKSCLSRTDG